MKRNYGIPEQKQQIDEFVLYQIVSKQVEQDQNKQIEKHKISTAVVMAWAMGSFLALILTLVWAFVLLLVGP